MSRAIRAAAMTALAVITLACGARGARPRTEPAMIAVENQAFSDMTVYVRDTGDGRRRLGTATGLSTTVLTIPSALVGNGRELHFEVDPIGSPRTALSNSLFVTPGDQVRMVIPPT